MAIIHPLKKSFPWLDFSRLDKNTGRADDTPEFFDPAEDCPWRTPREILSQHGYQPLPPNELDDQQLPGRLRKHEPKPPSLTGADLELFNKLQGVCHKLLTTGAKPTPGNAAGNTSPLALEKLAEYLRELQRSVERHTRLGGRRGYFEFLDGYIP